MSSHLCALMLFVLRGVFGGGTDVIKSVSVTEGESVTLNTDVTEVQKDDQILWMFGPKETRIAELYKQIIYMYDSDEIFGDRLQMDSQTGSLTIRNIRTEHSGLYKLQIISNRGISYKRFNLTVYVTSETKTQHLDTSLFCWPCSEMEQCSYFPLCITVVCVLLLLISACVFYCCCRKRKPEDEKSLSEYTQIIYRLQI